MRFIPGDQITIAENKDTQEYLGESKNRVQKFVAFARIERFAKYTVVFCAKSTHRWVVCRALHSKKRLDGERFVGVSKASPRIATSYRGIIDGGDSLSGRAINVQEGPITAASAF